MKKHYIDVYEYKDLDTNAKVKVIDLLDLYPEEYEEEDDFGDIVTKCRYFGGEAEDYEIQKHCKENNYLFTSEGDCIHHLIKEENEDENS